MSKRTDRGGWRALAAIVLLAGVVVRVGWVLRSSARTVSGEVGRAASVSARDDAALREQGSGEGIDARVAREERVLVSSVDVSTEAAPDQLTIVVVDRATGAVVPRARVLLQRADVDPVEWAAANERFGSVVAALENGFGVEHGCDEHGVVLVPRTTRRSWVMAGSEPRHGLARVQPGAASVRVELENQHCLSVEVVDRAQRPAANVRLVLLERDEMEWSRIWSGQSDERGRATIHTLDEDVSKAALRLVLGTALVRSQPAQFEFTLATVPSAPVRLVVDAGGVVELSLVDADGQPIEFAANMRLEIDRERAGELPLPMLEGWLQCWPSRDGRARYEHVGLGLPLVALASAPALDFADHDFEGPKLAAEIVHATVALRNAASIVRGRLLDVEGRALSQRTVEASATRVDAGRRRGYERLFETETKPDGTFAGKLSSLWDGVDISRVDLLVPMNGCSPARVEVACPPATIERVPLPHAVIELGDVIVHPPPLAPLVVAGRVVDESGRPKSGATIEICAMPAPAPPVWSDTLVASADDGRFEIRATIDAARVRVRAVTYRRSSAPVEVAVGATDIVLALREPGTILGTVLLPQGLDVDAFDLNLRAHESATGDSRRPSSYEWNDEGVFRSVVWPGRYGLEIQFEETTLAKLDDIDVVAGATVRLGPIDLREKLHAIEVNVVDERGEPVSEGDVGAFIDEHWAQRAAIAVGGRAVIASLSARLDVVVIAPGFRAQVFRAVTSGARLALSQGIDVGLKTASVEDDAFELDVELDYEGQDPLGAYAWQLRAIVGRDGTARIKLPLAGTYGVEFGLRRKASGALVRVADERQIAVVVVEQGAEISIELTKAEIEAALKRARGL